MDPQLAEFVKIVGAMLGTFLAAYANSRRQIGKVRKEHKTEQDKAQDVEQQRFANQQKIFDLQQKAIDDRNTEVVAKYTLLAEQFKTLYEAERKRSDQLQQALVAAQDTTQERARLLSAFETQTKILQEMHVYAQGTPERHKIYLQDVAATLTGKLDEHLAPVQKGITAKMSEEMKTLSDKLDARALANGEAFKALETGLNSLKVQVVALAAASGAEHVKTRADLLAKIDALTKLVARLAAPPGSEASKKEGGEK